MMWNGDAVAGQAEGFRATIPVTRPSSLFSSQCLNGGRLDLPSLVISSAVVGSAVRRKVKHHQPLKVNTSLPVKRDSTGSTEKNCRFSWKSGKYQKDHVMACDPYATSLKQGNGV